MAGFTKKTQTNETFAKGGKTKMFGAQDAGPQKAGETEHDVKGSGGKFASGGSTKMFGFAGAMPAQAGKSSAR